MQVWQTLVRSQSEVVLVCNGFTVEVYKFYVAYCHVRSSQMQR